jgi:hypothetical protein
MARRQIFYFWNCLLAMGNFQETLWLRNCASCVETLGSAASVAAAINPGARSAKRSALSFLLLQGASGRVKARVNAKGIEEDEKCDVDVE